MPELPEVENICIGLQDIVNSNIYDIKIFNSRLRISIPENLASIIKSKKILKIYRLGKYIIFSLNCDLILVFHMGMTGILKLQSKAELIKHDHVLICLKNTEDRDVYLVFNDARRFGLCTYMHESSMLQSKIFKNLGIDPFDKRLTTELIHAMLVKSKSSIKSFLLNGHKIVGIGNIYASEILFDAKISPLKICAEIYYSVCSALLISIRKILHNAIKYGGSTIQNYRSTDGAIGSFQKMHKVYGGGMCCVCQNSIVRLLQNGRSTFYCQFCQK